MVHARMSRYLAIWCGFVRWSQESDIFSWSSVRSVTLRFYSVTLMCLNIQLRILTAETQSSQRRGNLPYYQHLKKIAYFFEQIVVSVRSSSVRSAPLRFFFRKPPGQLSRYPLEVQRRHKKKKKEYALLYSSSHELVPSLIVLFQNRANILHHREWYADHYVLILQPGVPGRSSQPREKFTSPLR